MGYGHGLCFLYGKICLSLSEVEVVIVKLARRKWDGPLKASMTSQSIVQIYNDYAHDHGNWTKERVKTVIGDIITRWLFVFMSNFIFHPMFVIRLQISYFSIAGRRCNTWLWCFLKNMYIYLTFGTISSIFMFLEL